MPAFIWIIPHKESTARREDWGWWGRSVIVMAWCLKLRVVEVIMGAYIIYHAVQCSEI